MNYIYWLIILLPRKDTQYKKVDLNLAYNDLDV